MPPAWYKSLAYRSRAVVDPRGVLAEFGVELAGGSRCACTTFTADLRYLVMPARPTGTKGMSEKRWPRS